MKTITYTKITRKRLEECLKKIWWGLYSSWCDMYYIKNQYWNPTNWIFHSKKDTDIINEIKYDGKFWEWHEYSNGWSCVLVLKNYCIKIISDSTISICNKGKEDMIFLHFYNHNL